MKVLLAGYSNTGTNTIKDALTQLGYEVYGFLDHFWYHEKEWIKIIKKGGTAEDFKRMYKNVDAVVDAPVYFYWEEIVEAFPESKIILTVRDEDSWAICFHRQLQQQSITFLGFLLNIISPVKRRLFRFTQLCTPICFGGTFSSPLYGIQTNPLLLKKLLRRHNVNVYQNAPRDRLLVFSVKEGWEPLCSFLGKEIPHTPFPWKNKNGSEFKEMFMKHAFMAQLRKEFIVFLCLFFVTVCIILYYLKMIYSNNALSKPSR